jgi:hypothetical protein
MRVINKGRYCKCGKPAYCKRRCRACHNVAKQVAAIKQQAAVLVQETGRKFR